MITAAHKLLRDASLAVPGTKGRIGTAIEHAARKAGPPDEHSRGPASFLRGTPGCLSGWLPGPAGLLDSLKVHSESRMVGINIGDSFPCGGSESIELHACDLAILK